MSATSRLKAGPARLLGFIRRAPGRAMARAHRSPKRTFTVLGSLAVVLLLVSGLFLQMKSTRDGEEQARQEARSAGERGLVTLLSYDHKTVGQDLEDRKRLLTGPFQNEYANLVRDVVTPGAQRQKLTTSTSVARSSVIRHDGADRVWLMLFLNQTTNIEGRPDPVFNGSRVRVGMQHVGGQWAVSEITPL